MSQLAVAVYLLAPGHLDCCVRTPPASVTTDLGGHIPDPDLVTSSLLSRRGRAEEEKEQQQHLQ